MKKTSYLLFSFLIICASFVSFSPQDAFAQVAKSTLSPARETQPKKESSVIEGVWLTQKDEKNARIEISRCSGDTEKFCGKIVWLESPFYEDGTPKVDRKNPDPAKQNRPLLGLDLLTGFVKEGDNFWDHGKIYNPEDGDLYDCEISYHVENNVEKLEVRGYVGISLFGKTQVWIRSSL